LTSVNRTKEDHASLIVPPSLVEQVEKGPVADADFVNCIRMSLPYAWSVVSGLARQLADTGASVTDNQTPPPDEQSRGELLRLVGSDAMRGAIERHFGLRMAFQNCHRVALFDPAATDEFDEFVSPRAQLLNQRPEFVNC